MGERPGGDRRHFSRLAIDADATLAMAGQEHAVKVLDICLKGALLQMPAGVTVAHTGDWRLSITLAPDAVITMRCEPAHQAGDHVGVHCRHIDIDSIGHLRRLLELNLGDPELLNRELTELASPQT